MFSRFRQSKKLWGFTLLELLLIITVILILIGFVTVQNSKFSEKLKITKTKYILQKVCEAIYAFEQDWGELPPTLEYLVNPLLLKKYAKRKGIRVAQFSTYWDQQFDERSKVAYWSHKTSSTLCQASSKAVQGWNGKPSNNNYLMRAVYFEWVPKYDMWNGWGSSGEKLRANFWYLILDAWENPILYVVNTEYQNTGGATADFTRVQDGTFMLFSAGLDENVSVNGHNVDSPTKPSRDAFSQETGKRSYNFKWFFYDYNFTYTNGNFGPIKLSASAQHIPEYDPDHIFNRDNIYHEASARSTLID